MGISHLQLICGQNLTEFYSVVLTYAFREHFRATSAATVSTSADGPALQFTSATLPRTYLLLK